MLEKEQKNKYIKIELQTKPTTLKKNEEKLLKSKRGI